MTRQEVVKTYLKALGDADYETIASLYADNATLEDPVGGDINLSGVDAIREFYKASVALDLEGKLLGSIRVAGDEALFPFEIRINKPAEGAPMAIEVIDSFRFNEEGKVVAMKAYWGPENIKML